MKKVILSLVLSCIGMILYAQTKVEGTVYDDMGPAIGVNITVPGTTLGTITDFDGHFEISVPSDAKTIRFSYVGYQVQELPIKAHMKVTLKAETQEIQEVVVTGMQVLDKRMTTGATTQIDADKTKLDGVADVSRSLEGRAAGVSVQSVSGTFGTAPKIRVRGATSIYGSSKPLWVVDGVVLEDAVEVSSDDLSSGDAATLIASAIAGLNADDIESFQILKDGSATSIYGARAMAGVIVVTTKKGKQGVSRLSYTGELTYRLKPNYRNFNISNSQEQMSINKQMADKGLLEFTTLNAANNYGVYGKMYELINTYDESTGSYMLANTPAARNAYLQEAELRNTDWFDLLFQDNLMQNHAVSMSAGTDKARYYASMSAMYDPGWTLSNDVQRYTANFNGSYDILKNLTFALLSNASYRKQTAPGTTNSTLDVVNGAVTRDFDINPYSYAINTSRALDPDEYYRRNYTDFNIFNELQRNYIDINIMDVKFQGELKYKPVKGLEINGLVSYRYQNAKQEHHIHEASNQANAYRAGIYPEDATIRDANKYLYTDPDDPSALPVCVLPEGTGIYTVTTNSMSSLDLRATAAYNTAFDGEKHLLNLFAGAELNSIDRQETWFRGWGMQYDNGSTPFWDPQIFKQLKEEGAEYYYDSWTYSRNLAFFAMATYSYNRRYTLNGTFRYEGSNKLGRSRKARWLPTWNVSAAWNMHEENWWRNTFEDAWTHSTLRASYSLTADRGPAFVTNSLPVYIADTPWRPNAGDQESGIVLGDLENSELTYEKKYEFNIGWDLGFVNNRVNLSADFYTRENFDLIGITTTPGVGGVVLKYANVANMSSYGVEGTLSTVNIKTKDFTWTTDLTFSDAQNKITALESHANMINMVYGGGYALEGYPVRSLFSLNFAGLNEEGLPTFTKADGKTELPLSEINFQQRTGLEDILVYEGPTDPTITGGFGNTLSYKGFSLNVFLTYSFGNVIRLDPVFSYSYDDMTALPREFANRWVTQGDEAYTNIPTIPDKRLIQKYTSSELQRLYNAYNFSTERVAKGDFIRLKDVSLSYDFPKKWFEGYKVTSLALKLQATNLCLLYADKKLNGQDPEFFNTGGVAMPSPKQFTFTLRLGL